MATPTNQAPAIDPRVIQSYRFVAVSATGVRTPVDPGGGSHHRAEEAVAIANTLKATTGAAFVEVWPPAPAGHNPMIV